MENNLKQKIGQRLVAHSIFQSDEQEIRLCRRCVGKHGCEASSELPQAVEPTLTQPPALVKGSRRVGTLAQQLLEQGLTDGRMSKIVVVLFNLLDLRLRPACLHESAALGANEFSYLGRANCGKGVWQNRWQLIRGALVVGVPGSDNGHNDGIQPRE